MSEEKDFSKEFSEVLDEIGLVKEAVAFPREIGIGEVEVDEKRNKSWLWKTWKRELNPDLEDCLKKVEAIIEELDKSENKKIKERYEIKEENRILKEEITSLKVGQETLKGQVQRIQAELQLKDAEVIRKNHELELKDEELNRKQKMLEQKDDDLRERDRVIKQMDEKLNTIGETMKRLNNNVDNMDNRLNSIGSFNTVNQEFALREFRRNQEFALQEFKTEVKGIANLIEGSRKI